TASAAPAPPRGRPATPRIHGGSGRERSALRPGCRRRCRRSKSRRSRSRPASSACANRRGRARARGGRIRGCRRSSFHQDNSGGKMPPLTGITVVDLTRYLPGPFASRELLRLGARVVKIEPPDGDPLEASAPGWYRALNDGKEISTWDALSEPQPAVLEEADVVLEGFRPGVIERPGVTLDERAILCPLTGYGTDGERVLHAGHDLNYMGYAGVLADTAPALPPVQVADLCAGAQAVVTEILAALLERERT